MELIQKNLLPHSVKRLGRIRKHSIRHGGQQLQIHHHKLRLAVRALIPRHGGVSSSMIFKIELAFPYRKSPVPAYSLIQLFEIRARELLTDHGDSLYALLHTDRGLQHVSGRTAAAVTVAVRDQNVSVDILILISLPAAHNCVRMQHSVIRCEEFRCRLSHSQCRN